MWRRPLLPSNDAISLTSRVTWPRSQALWDQEAKQVTNLKKINSLLKNTKNCFGWQAGWVKWLSSPPSYDRQSSLVFIDLQLVRTSDKMSAHRSIKMANCTRFWKLLFFFFFSFSFAPLSLIQWHLATLSANEPPSTCAGQISIEIQVRRRVIDWSTHLHLLATDMYRCLETER